MALQITKLMTSRGQSFSNSYARIEAQVSENGTKIEVNVNYYLSKIKYQENASNNSFIIDGVPRFEIFNYDRAIDGADILTIAHNKFKELLISQVNTPGGDNKPNSFYQEFNDVDIAIIDL